jgi:hypothetical protein
MEDIIALIRWTLAVRRKCRIRMLPIATLSGPTSGKLWLCISLRSYEDLYLITLSTISHIYIVSGANYWQELKEWARQIRRWTIGAAEVFHYFVIKAGRLPIPVSIAWGMRFVFYYGILLCISPIYGLVSPFLVRKVPSGPDLDNTVTVFPLVSGLDHA